MRRAAGWLGLAALLALAVAPLFVIRIHVAGDVPPFKGKHLLLIELLTDVAFILAIIVGGALVVVGWCTAAQACWRLAKESRR